MAIENMIIQYLRDNKELLANMDFQTLYNNLPPGLRASLTKIFYDAKINPLNYNLEYIPSGFAWTLDSSVPFPTKLIIPKGIKEIDTNAFNACYHLQVVTIPNSTIVIKENAFKNCKNLKEVEIGNGLMHLGYQAFYGCKRLEKINLPKSLKHIESKVFDNCINLPEIEYEGTLSEWNAIDISNDNITLSLCNIHCSDGEILNA